MRDSTGCSEYGCLLQASRAFVIDSNRPEQNSIPNQKCADGILLLIRQPTRLVPRIKVGALHVTAFGAKLERVVHSTVENCPKSTYSIEIMRHESLHITLKPPTAARM